MTLKRRVEKMEGRLAGVLTLVEGYDFPLHRAPRCVNDEGDYDFEAFTDDELRVTAGDGIEIGERLPVERDHGRRKETDRWRRTCRRRVEV